MQCPKCKTDSAHRSHRAGLKEQLVSMVGYHPYRCWKCKHRFLSLPNSPPELAATGTRSVEREISHTQGSLRWKRKRRDLILYGSALILFGIVLYFLTRAPSMGE